MSVMTGMWPRIYARLSAIQPFTYRDGLTFQELLYLIKDKVEELIAFCVEVRQSLAELDAEFDQVKKDLDDRFATLKAEIEDQRIKDLAEMRDLIENIAVGGIAFNPTNGKSHESVSKVISDVYDNVRTSAWFLDQIDSRDLTAAQHDALGLRARTFDLDPESDTIHPTNP